MNILHLTWEYPPRIVGGLARHVYYLSKEIANLNNQVYVVTLDFPNTKEEEIHGNLHVYRVKVELVSYDFLTWVYAFNHFFEKKVGMIIKNNDIDIIHVHDWLTSLSGIALKYLLKKPLIVTMHSLEIGRVGSLNNSLSITINNLEWWVTYEAKRVITTTNYMKQELVRHFNLPEDKIDVISNGINVYEFDLNIDKKSARNILGLEEDLKIILFIGRIVEQKGIQYLVEASPNVISKIKNCLFLIIGEGWLLESIKKRVYELGVNNNFKFLGHVSDEMLKIAIKASDVLVIPSIYEPFGIVALEGMAGRIPVIASAVGGLKEIIEDGINGIYVNNVRNLEELSNAIVRILTDNELSEKLVNNAYKKVKNFDWKEIAKKTIEIYKKII